MANEELNRWMRASVGSGSSAEAPRPEQREEPIEVAELVGALDSMTAQLQTALEGVQAIRDDLSAQLKRVYMSGFRELKQG
jgi:hypothetical protein